MKNDLETRSGGVAAEVRSVGDEIKVSGYAVVWNEIADIGGWFSERFLPNAFTEALERGDDVVFLVNHRGLPLARTTSGTLTLTQDSRGLKMETTLNANDPDVQQIVPKMERGDLTKMSFAFTPEIQEWDETQDPPLRTISKSLISDVSIVTSPAYSGTDIGLRSLEAHRKTKNSVAAQSRLAMKANLDLRERNER